MTLHLSEFRVYVAINGDTYSSIVVKKYSSIVYEYMRIVV